MTRQAAIYARISKDREGAGLGVERQRNDCAELAGRLGWSVITTHTDNDLSAYSGKPRPGYKALLEDIHAGRVDAVLAWHTDRLHRSPVELETYIAVCEPRSIPTHCVKAGPLDLSTPSGRLVARQLGAVARYEAEHMSERIKGQKERAAAAGEWLGGARPFGYTRNGMVIIPEEAAVIRDGIRRALAGESIHSIAALWRATVKGPNGGTWHPANISKMLTRPRNAGFMVHRGEVIGKGSFPAIISEDEYHAVCAILSDPKRTTYAGPRSLKYLGSGLYVCGRCGAHMRSAGARVNGAACPTYRCRVLGPGHVSINAEPVDDFVIEVVCERLDLAGPTLLPAVAGQHDLLARLRDEATALRVRYEQLDDMFSDGEITRAGRTKQRERIEKKLTEINVQLGRYMTTPLVGIADARTPSTAFLAQPLTRRRAILDTLMTVTIHPGRPGRLPGGGVDVDRVQIDWRSG